MTCIQMSQKAGKVVWYSYFCKNFPQFIVMHTIKGFSVVNEAEVDVFLKFSCFFCDPKDVGNLISGSLPFLNPAWTYGSSRCTYAEVSMQDFEHDLSSVGDEYNCPVV